MPRLYRKPTSYGTRQSPAMLISQERYRARQAGTVAPVEYLPVSRAVEVLD